LKCGEGEHASHYLKPYNRGEDLVVVDAFDLREAFGNQAGFLSTISLHIKDPTVLYDLVINGAIGDFPDFAFFEHG
jgi:hypothetical protein